jgi:hypothetical protein
MGLGVCGVFYERGCMTVQILRWQFTVADFARKDDEANALYEYLQRAAAIQLSSDVLVEVRKEYDKLASPLPRATPLLGVRNKSRHRTHCARCAR